MADSLLTVRQTMERLAVSERTLRSMTTRGVIRALRSGGRKVYLESEVDKYIKSLEEWDTRRSAA